MSGMFDSAVQAAIDLLEAREVAYTEYRMAERDWARLEASGRDAREADGARARAFKCYSELAQQVEDLRKVLG